MSRICVFHRHPAAHVASAVRSLKVSRLRTLPASRSAILILSGIVALSGVSPAAGVGQISGLDDVDTKGLLQGVDSIAENDAWAVGFEQKPGGAQVTLTQHWNGLVWKRVPSPNASRGPQAANELNGVSAASPMDVWAVGRFINRHRLSSTLIEHWDGMSWQIVPAPNPGYESELLAVSFNSSTDGWAVGDTVRQSGRSQAILCLHWDGVSWQRVKVVRPHDTPATEFRSVWARASDDVWAVGDYATEDGNGTEALVEHWDGKQWSQVRSAGPGGGAAYSYLSGVSGLGSLEAWAVGGSSGGESRHTGTFAEHWDGSRWMRVAGPRLPGTGDSVLQSVYAIGRSDAWAVGYRSRQPAAMLIEHWNGTVWRKVNLASGGGRPRLLSVSMASATSGWAVGYRAVGGAPVAMQWDGRHWLSVED